MKRVPALLVWAGFPGLYFAAALLFLLAVPQPRQPFADLVAGAFATAVSLIAALALSLKRSPARTPRRSGRSS